MNVIDASPCKVISKYFSSCPVMDESLSEFQEKKTSTKGPKSRKKPGSSQTGINKPKKRLKGQKDIRTALKSQKNQLLAYTKEFDEVCKQSGVDIDSEQLQLAIALSKSLQTDTNNGNHSSQNSLTPKERSSKIRTTLQEYGFTVPEIKITSNSRNHRKLKRNYRLLQVSAEEKQQIISDKYSQVLFEVCTQSKLVDYKLFNNSNKKLYFVSTSMSYSDMRNNDILYVDDLIDKSTSTGNLLRDWSDIPGRPNSPQKSEPFNMNFSEIDCSQDELDIVLSGTLKAAKKVVKEKAQTVTDTILIEDTKCDKSNEFESPTHNIACENSQENMQSNTGCKYNSSARLEILEAPRSFSPDIFDDEGSVLDNSRGNESEIYSQLITSIAQHNDEQCTVHEKDTKIALSSKNILNHVSSIPVNVECSYDVTKRKSDDFMEVTSCVQGNLVAESVVHIKESKINCSDNETISQHHKTTDKTKRISNDLMEITECVTNHINIPHYLPTDNFDLTQNSEEVINVTITETNVNKQYISNNVANIDLTQKSDENNDVIEVECNENSNINNLSSRRSSSGDELPFVHISGSNNNNNSQSDSDDTIILNDEEINGVLNSTTSQAMLGFNKENDSIRVSQRFFDDFVHDHSDSFGDKGSKSNDKDDQIDLTQSSDSTDIDKVDIQEKPNCSEILHKSSLGKKDDVSIDYDDLYNDVLRQSHGSLSFNYSKKSVNTPSGSNLSQSKVSSECSYQNYEVLEVCDEELNYSLNKSRHDVGWDNFGGISVVNSITEMENRRNSDDINSREMDGGTNHSDSFLPPIDLNQDDIQTKITSNTPKQDIVKTKSVITETPSSDYIIRTDQVTPMLDYASMSTPERKRELDKYGLKPFKRKRAIQLLQHIYNQTHPVVEPCLDQPSPSKKQKPNQPSPKESLKPESSNQILDTEISNKENLYEVTKEQPDLRSIACLEEDMVFQKREKAKIHSCRVPLHIAFHNYVSCRQRLREAILRYEPVNIDVIHKDLVSLGYRYDPKDLLKFLDKKCITVKTADNTARNKRHN